MFSLKVNAEEELPTVFNEELTGSGSDSNESKDSNFIHVPKMSHDSGIRRARGQLAGSARYRFPLEFSDRNKVKFIQRVSRLDRKFDDLQRQRVRLDRKVKRLAMEDALAEKASAALTQYSLNQHRNYIRNQLKRRLRHHNVISISENLPRRLARTTLCVRAAGSVCVRSVSTSETTINNFTFNAGMPC